MAKCVITKSMPGLECKKCENIVHLNTQCSGVTHKQITALKATSSLVWTCLDCQRNSPKRNSSIIIPESNDEEEDDTPVQINAGKLLGNITKEIEKAIKSEMRDLNESLNFHSAKLDEVMECIHAFKQTIKVLERKNIDLTNKNNNLQIRVGALEQRLQEIEQEKLDKTVEIANVPSEGIENVNNLIKNVALKLKQPPEVIKSVKIINRKEGPANIQVQLQDESSQLKWISAAKSTKIHLYQKFALPSVTTRTSCTSEKP